MKRVIKYWNTFNSDKAQFANCGTEYEILPILVEDSAGPQELMAIAKQLGINVKGLKVETLNIQKGYSLRNNVITHYIDIGEKTEPRFYDKKVFDWYLGFVTLNETVLILKPSAKLNKLINIEQSDVIINERSYGLSDVGNFSRTKKADFKIIMEDWSYYHEIKLLGYNLEAFERLVTGKRTHATVDRTFSDSVFMCDMCDVYDDLGNGYVDNYIMTNHNRLGVNCGCAREHEKDNFLNNVNKHEKYISKETATELEKEGLIEHVERFIDGMTDGRGGYYGGESVREGSPGSILAEMLGKEPKSNFLMSHDESGQFQTYFSIYRVTKKGPKNNKSRKVA